ncbi:MAG TPA: hypothetical protein PK603_07095 [Bacteroidales bacterium]|nr:hypothetical protein [Bacteroidales bacterium]
MDTSLLASHCIELLRTHNRVSLGNMGSFMAEDTPATLTHNLHVLLPPGRRISFKESETWNDGLLEKVYGNPDALEALLSEVSKKLLREKSVTLDGFGKLRRTREGDVFFVMDKNVSVNPGGFGLVPLSMSPLSTPSKIKCPTLDPQAEEGKEEPDGSKTQAEAVPGDERATDQGGTTDRSEATPRQETGKKTPRQETGNTPRRVPRGLVVFLVVLLVLVLCLFLIYVFKDSLRPVLEKILYSAEERRLL